MQSQLINVQIITVKFSHKLQFFVEIFFICCFQYRRFSSLYNKPDIQAEFEYHRLSGLVLQRKYVGTYLGHFLDDLLHLNQNHIVYMAFICVVAWDISFFFAKRQVYDTLHCHFLHNSEARATYQTKRVESFFWLHRSYHIHVLEMETL